MTDSRRAALYLRASTPGQSVEPQRAPLATYAEARGLEVVEAYEDAAVSGSKRQRPGLDRLLADARRRRFDVLVVVKLDRLGRSLHHLLEILGELDELGIAFVSVDDAIDTRTSLGRLFMQIRGAFAEYERALVIERTRAGLDQARRRGKRLGRRPVLDSKKRARARRMAAAGKSVRHVARVLGCSTGAAHAAMKG